MLIMIYGDDNFRVHEKMKQMKDAFKAKYDASGMNTSIFPSSDASKIDQGEVLQAACSYPFLADKRMVLVSDLISTQKKDTHKAWLEGFGRIPDSTIVVLHENASPASLQKKALFKELSKMSEVHTYPFPELQGSLLSGWVYSRIKQKGGTIDPSALRGLTERVGSDLWQMSHEVNKLVVHAGGDQITDVMVKDLVHASFEGQIFALMDAISKKQSSRAIQLLQEERFSGANDHYLLTMLTRQVRLLLGARAVLDKNPRATKQDVADATGSHPFAAQKALEQARSFSFPDLKKAHDLLFEYDRGMKTGRISAELAVDLVTDQLLK
jgi:DNA polymerase III subunit delta